MTPVPPLLVLQARADARARLYRAGFYDSIENALAPLFADALQSGLVDELSEAGVKAVIEIPFLEQAVDD